ncbi:hypothetical protein [uncultured Legionella sp.]|uniref:hypothetical protein n=1 Tax=uncultured Legionella sp. TaxID=210934 RepID=UPI00262C798A|nr:hypothetical protein [uncultured Legionella sp.]
MDDMDKEQRNALLIEAWNASIRLTAKTENRFAFILEKAEQEPVYLISNTNELNIREILNLFKKSHPYLKFADLSVPHFEEPIELLPNVFVCFSYQLHAFKEKTNTTPGLIEYVVSKSCGPTSLVSQYLLDRIKAEEMQLQHVLTADEFYEPCPLTLRFKKNQ